MIIKITQEDREGLKKCFENFGRHKTDEEIFYDLCFCICAPQTTFKSNSIAIGNLIAARLYTHSRTKEEIENLIKMTRFYRNKTKYLFEAKEKFDWILYEVKTRTGATFKRDWLVKNVKGLGMKAASQFLRNLGDENLAIIDTHIIKFLKSQPTLPAVHLSEITNNVKDNSQAYYMLKENLHTSIGKKDYIILEKIFQKIAQEYKLTVAELDALIWKKYSNTPWKNFKF